MLDRLRDRLRDMIKPPPPPPPPPAPAAPPKPATAHAPAAHAAAGSGTAATRSGIAEAARGTLDGARLKNGINALNSDGDRAILRVTPEAKVQANLRGVKVGPKAQLGAQISVTRNGDDDAKATYTVRYDKHTLGALAAEAGASTLKGGRAGKGAIDPTLKAELGAQTFDAVEMTFASKADAQRAADTLQRLQLADMADDAVDLAASGAPLPVKLPLGAADKTLSGGGSNPAANPLTHDGAPGRLANRVAGVEQGDLDFLQNNISAYEQTIGSRGRLAAEVKGDLKILDGALEGRVDGSQRISRRVEMPGSGKDGSVTYSVSQNLRLSAKERATRKLEQMTGGILAVKADNRLELANATTTASLRYAIPAGTDLTASAGGRPVPEADAHSNKIPLTLDRVSVENRLQWRDQSLADVSRGDSTIVTERLVLNSPENLRGAADRLFKGDFKGAASAAGARVELQADDLRATGTDTQPGLKIDLKVADAEATAILISGVDDVIARREAIVQAGTPATPGIPGVPPTTAQDIPPAPADDGRTYAVEPYVGAQIRNAPAGESVGVIQSGSFVRDAGGRQTDGDGHDWMQVTGTDEKDRPVEGWVRSDLLVRHDAAKGAMDEQGRINPANEYNRMDRITVQKDDNLWNLAKEHGWDYDRTLAANGGHLRNPSLIFKGDTVYVPDSAKGPKPVERTVPGTPAVPGQAGTASVETRSTGQTDSAAPTRSGDAAAAGGNAAPVQAPGAVSGTGPAAAGASANDVPGRPALGDILARNQVAADPDLRNWKPDLFKGAGGILAGAAAEAANTVGIDLKASLERLDQTRFNKSEAAVLDRLNPADQLKWMKITQDAESDAKAAYQQPAGYTGNPGDFTNDGHADAYRHALWNARMTRAFGQSWAAEYATAHEMVPGNPAAREAMDLHNNEVGRRIAVQNPHASDADLQALVRAAVERGDLVVVDRSGNLAWSDRVALGQHGNIGPGTAEGRPNPLLAPNPERADPTGS